MSPRADPDPRIRRALEPWLGLETDAGLLLAVSGGVDSTALLHAAAAMPRRRPLHVATVDHGLRLAAAAEAAGVAEAAGRLGLPHATLCWTDAPPAAAIQAQARAARYRLLAAHAAAVGADAVLTAHTRDDQAETVLLRLIAGSGPLGLAGMRATRELAAGVRLGRPFLDIAKADLVAWCAARGLAFVDDPSNADPRFGRVRLRRLMPVLEREGLGADRLVRLAERAARDEAALAEAAAAAFARAAARFPLPSAGGGEGTAGTLQLHGPTLAALPDAIALRVLDLALDHAGGTRPRRLLRLERLALDDLLPALRAGRPVRRTLRGLVIAADAAGGVTIRAAPARRAGLAAGASALLGKARGSAYIGEACADGPAAAATRPARSKD